MTHFNPLESPYCLAITLLPNFSASQQHIVFTFSINLTFRCSSLMSAIAKQKGVGVPSGPVSEQLLIPFPFQHNGGKRGEKLTQNATTIHSGQNDLVFRPEKLPQLGFELIPFRNKYPRGQGFKF